MIKHFFIILIAAITIQNSYGQNPFPEDGTLYRDDILPRVDILIHPDSLDEILDSENRWSYYHYHADFIIDNNEKKDTIKNIGFRLRGNTSRSSAKKSFKVSFNTYEQGRKYRGVEKINLNGEHNDPSIIRSKLCADLAKEMGIPSPRANHVKLYINGDYFGLYINVEHIDEEYVKTRYGNNNGNLYKCLYPAELHYLGSNPEDYKLEQNGRRIYDLKTNTESDDYADIATFISILNTTPHENFRCELEKVFNVDAYIKVMVFDILTANWDGHIFNKNNFYLYKNTQTNKFEYILYDLDNTFGIDWFGVDWSKRNIYEWSPSWDNRPLYERIMADPVYQSRFSTLMKEILETVFIPEEIEAYLTSKKGLISPAAIQDQYRTYDYGFTFSDFTTSYDVAIDYNHVPIGINEYISRRSFWTYIQLGSAQLFPDIKEWKVDLNETNDSIYFSTSIYNVPKLSEIKLWYKLDDGTLESLSLNDNGQAYDLFSNDGIYTSPTIGTSSFQNIQYYFELNDLDGYNHRVPVCEFANLHIANTTPTLSVNEFMASNTTIIADENEEFDDWFEIYNYGDGPVYLGDKYCTDKPDNPSKWKMPDMWLASKAFLLFWADKDEEQGDHHCNFKLSAGGEYIGIYNSEIRNFELIDGYEFGEQTEDVAMGRLPNGIGTFQILPPTPGYNNDPDATVEEQSTSNLNLYPNPSSNFLYLDQTFEDQKINTIAIYDINGSLIRYIDKNELLNKVNISDLRSGTYFIETTLKDTSVRSKFVKINTK